MGSTSTGASSGSLRCGIGGGATFIFGSFLLKIGIDGFHFFFFSVGGGAGDCKAGSSRVVSLGRVLSGAGESEEWSSGGGCRWRGGEKGLSSTSGSPGR